MPMTTTDHERAEFLRAAHAMYARGQTTLGHLLSTAGALRILPLAQYDSAAAVYQDWLVFDEPKVSA